MGGPFVADEGELNRDIMNFDEGELRYAIKRISDARKAYEDSAIALENYFENDLKQAAVGEFYDALHECYSNNKKASIKRVISFLDGVIAHLISETDDGEASTEEWVKHVKSA